MWRRSERSGRNRCTDLLVATLAGLALISAAVPLAACAGSDEDGSGEAVYTESDSGQTVKASVGGDRITIRLSENPSTGYTWQVRHSAGLEPHGDDFVAPSASPPAVGAPGTRVLRFEATAAGTQRVYAVYNRPWPGSEQETMHARPLTFSLTIEVE